MCKVGLAVGDGIGWFCNTHDQCHQSYGPHHDPLTAWLHKHGTLGTSSHSHPHPDHSPWINPLSTHFPNIPNTLIPCNRLTQISPDPCSKRQPAKLSHGTDPLLSVVHCANQVPKELTLVRLSHRHLHIHHRNSFFSTPCHSPWRTLFSPLTTGDIPSVTFVQSKNLLDHLL